jgi:hypothetical protein
MRRGDATQCNAMQDSASPEEGCCEEETARGEERTGCWSTNAGHFGDVLRQSLGGSLPGFAPMWIYDDDCPTATLGIGRAQSRGS